MGSKLPQVLYVENDPVNRLLMTEIFIQADDMRLIVAESGGEALDVAANEDIDLVITDQTMPELSGEALIQSLHELNPDLPVIICSGHVESVVTDASLAMGAAAFISKPVDVTLLLHTLSEHLEILDSD